jgi:3-hydroxyisobutyrate dehydrogenase
VLISEKPGCQLAAGLLLKTGCLAMRIGLIGVGLMGLPLAERLVSQGISVSVYNRTNVKVEPLRALGVEIATQPDNVIRACDATILMVTDAQAISEVLFTNADALFGRTILQMGTIAPQENIQIQARVESYGGSYLEAPVLGSIPEAKAGTLLVMVGATAAQFQQWLPILSLLGSNPIHLGAVGQASAVKLALNHLIAGLTATFGLSLRLVQQSGASVDAFMAILRESALYAPTFDKKLTRMLTHDYANPNFPTKHLLKDVHLFATAAEQSGLDNQLTRGMQAVIERAIAQGLGELDYSAIVEAFGEN